MSEYLLIGALGENGSRQITLNRPNFANAIDSELSDALLSALESASVDGTRILVLRATGKHFSGGFNFSGYEAASEGDILLRFVRIEQALQLLWEAPFVSIARIPCAAIGAGADLAAACTYRVGTPSSVFRFPGYRFGVALGTRRLATIVGERHACDLLLANQRLEGRQAFDCGLLTHLVDDNGLDSAIDDIIRQIGDLDSPSIAALLNNVRISRQTADRDLAGLVRSVARPGLHARIKKFHASTESPQAVQR